MAFPEATRKVPVAWLTGSKDLPHFHTPGVLLLGNIVRDCSWDGRPAATNRVARKVLLGLSLVLIVALTMDTGCNVPYVRRMCVALLL